MHIPFLADLSNLPWVAIVAVGGSMLLTIVVIVGGLIIAYHRQKQWHETARLALEKGQPLPASQEAAPPPRKTSSGIGGDIRAGLILIAVGAGLYIFLGTLVGQALGYVGAIPGFIGIALLLYGLLSALLKRNDPPPTDRP